MKLFLVRHGEAQGNLDGRFMGHSDLKLTPRGRAQAKAVANALGREENVTGLYSSPLACAQETAETISRVLGLPVRLLEDLAELNVGPLEGLTRAEREVQYPEFTAQWYRDATRAVLPGFEPLAHVQERAWRSAENLLEAHGEETVVAVSHYNPILTLLGKGLGLPIAKFCKVDVDLASISIVDLRKNSSRLVAINNLCHLSHDHDPPLATELPFAADVRG